MSGQSRDQLSSSMGSISHQTGLVLFGEMAEESWDQIGGIIKVDTSTLIASRGKFARVCVEVDLSKPLKSGYMLQGEYRKLQYEDLHDICFFYGQYGHRDANCPLKSSEAKTSEAVEDQHIPKTEKSDAKKATNNHLNEGFRE